METKLSKLFNKIFDKGIYPINWTESIILPLYKKGNISDPKNYRGISLLDVTSKLYSCIINDRLRTWIDRNDTVGEHQAGFRRDYSTIERIFTLLANVQKQLVLNRKLYVAVHDFKKAFDSVSRHLLWPILQKNKIKGKLFCAIRGMYDTVLAPVRSGNRLSDLIECNHGVKQGDVCRPVLFSLFINELAHAMIREEKHGTVVSPELIELFILLFADDLLLMSETPIGLQNQLNSLWKSAKKHDLKVNLNQSSVIVFRKGGFWGRKDKWFYGNSELHVVNKYKYLNLFFFTKLNFNAVVRDLSGKAKTAVMRVLSVLYRIESHSLDLKFADFIVWC